MIARPRLVLASNNAGKLREFRRLLQSLGIEVIAQSVPGEDRPVDIETAVGVEDDLKHGLAGSEEDGTIGSDDRVKNPDVLRADRNPVDEIDEDRLVDVQS